MAEGPVFALYVRSVQGHLVPHFGSREYIGVTVRGLTPEQRAAGEQAIVWNTKRIVPITAQETVTYRKEYDSAIQTGALQQVTEAEYLEQVEADEEADKQAAAKAKADAAAEAKRNATTQPKGAE